MTSEVLAESAVVVGATAPDQGSAIDLVGSILVAQGSRDAAEIHRTLTAPDDDAPAANGHPARSDEVTLEIRITNPAGLHARPAAIVVDRARSFAAELAIQSNGKRANARSITALLGLGAAVGDEVRIVARGSDARSAADAIAAILTGSTEV
ncbi:MAG: HPr family phosphocarrier protein [Chloroflexi bacterium]|nr:MAG: HPr family phosphocarrier protein [Chloroflexota bacterium]